VNPGSFIGDHTLRVGQPAGLVEYGSIAELPAGSKSSPHNVKHIFGTSDDGIISRSAVGVCRN
jgi:hypothetical protein